MTRLLTIASGKGGTGKTWLAIALAQALAERGSQGRRVLLVDADWGLANVDVQLGLRSPVAFDPRRGLRAMTEAVERVDEGGFEVLPGASGSGRFADLSTEAVDRFQAALTTFAKARRYDDVVVDLAAGADLPVRTLWSAGDTKLLVISPDPSALTDGYALAKLCRTDGDRAAPTVVVNRATSRPAGEVAGLKLTRALQGFLGVGAAPASVLLEEPRVLDAVRAQTPFLRRHPASPMATAIRDLAANLPASDQKPSAAPSFRLSEAAT
ncbi:MAG: AAA family ATPase [Pseudomonadota bacterium]